MVTLKLFSGKLYENLALKLTCWGKIYIYITIQTLSRRSIEYTKAFSLIKIAKVIGFVFHFLEMHRTQSEFDDNLTFKVFIFQFINFYSSIFYVAFFKGRFVGYPGHYNHIVFNLRNEDVSSKPIFCTLHSNCNIFAELYMDLWY